MKQVQFTLQFVILLAAMPLLVVMQFAHDNRDIVKEKSSTESESVYISRPSVSGDVFLSPSRLVLM